MTEAARHSAALRRAAAVSGLIQGEVLEVSDACAFVADSAWPLSDLASQEAALRETGGEHGVLVPVQEGCERVVILTQTCDLQSTGIDERTCQVALVIDSDPTFAREVIRGRRPTWIALPWVSNLAVADLSKITTLERSVVVDVPTLGRPSSTHEQLHFASMLGRYFSRPALPDGVNDVLRPFVRRIQDRHDKQTAEGWCLQRVATFRVEADPDFDAVNPSLNVLVIVDEAYMPSLAPGSVPNQARIDELTQMQLEEVAAMIRDEAEPLRRREAWLALAEIWVAPAAKASVDGSHVVSVESFVLNGAELTFARSRNAPELDLMYLSTRG